MSNQLIILGTVIPQQHDLFNLKDLHQLSGGKKTHEPYQFIRLDQTQELIKAIEAEGNTAVKTYRGTQGGTYACKEIVIAYAAWISPQFHLVVLRAFLNQLENSQKTTEIQPLALPEKPRKIQGKTRAPEGEYLYTREFSAMEIDHLAKLWDIAEEQHKFIESLTPLFETMQSEQWFKKHSRALNCFNHHNYSYHILSEMCEDVEEWTGIMPSIRAVKMKGKYYSRF